MFQKSTLKLGGEGGSGETWKKWGDIFTIQYSHQNNGDVEVLPTYFVVGCLRNKFSINCCFVVFLASLTHTQIQ